MQAISQMRKLGAGQCACGSWVGLRSPLGAEVMGKENFDGLRIDMEHGSGKFQALGVTLPTLRPREIRCPA